MKILQAIETKYVGATNHRGSRIIATTPGGHRHTQQWDYALSIDANHYAAAEALRTKLDWPAIRAGCTTNNGFVFATSILEA